MLFAAAKRRPPRPGNHVQGTGIGETVSGSLLT